MMSPLYLIVEKANTPLLVGFVGMRGVYVCINSLRQGDWNSLPYFPWHNSKARHI